MPRICLLLAACAAAAGGASGHTFVDSVRPPSGNGTTPAASWRVVRADLTRAESATPMDFRISLRMRDVDGLRTRIHAGERISPADLDAHYLPLDSDYQRLLSWCRQMGFEVTMEDRNHTTVYLRGSIDQIGKAMGARFSRVGNGTAEYSSAVTPPSLPDAIAGPVLSVSGLQPERTPVRVRGHHFSPQIIQGGGVRGGRLDKELSQICLYHASASGISTTLPAIRSARRSARCLSRIRRKEGFLIVMLSPTGSPLGRNKSRK